MITVIMVLLVRDVGRVSQKNSCKIGEKDFLNYSKVKLFSTEIFVLIRNGYL